MSESPRQPTAALNESAVDALLRDTTPWLSCEECFERMDAYAEAVAYHAATPDEAMTTHLQGCAACHDEAQSLIDLLSTW